MKTKGVSITKFEQGVQNEDAERHDAKLIAVADGAGGGGVFAERWSLYLCNKLPKEPITSFEGLDAWIDGIWESFYQDCEIDAQNRNDAMLLHKFYEEGSFSTLAAMWECGDRMQWMTYGDSVAFHYNFKTHILEHSFTRLVDFNSPPDLINCKDPLLSVGFKSGCFSGDKDSVFFVASDALSHYILMMYLAANRDLNEQQLNEAIAAHSKNSMMVKSALLQEKIDFTQVIRKLVNCANHAHNFKRHIELLRKQGFIGHDDYSFAVMTN